MTKYYRHALTTCEVWDHHSIETTYAHLPMTDLELSQDPKTGQKILIRLIHSDDERVRTNVIFHPSTPVELLGHVINSQDCGDRYALTLRNDLPIDFVDELIRDPDDQVRNTTLIRNFDKISDLTLHSMIETGNSRFRELVAERTANPDTLDTLAKDPFCCVRSKVARNRNTGPRMLERLSKDIEPGVRIAIASNHLCPKDIILVLSKDAELEVRLAVAKHHRKSPDVSKALFGQLGFT